MGDRGKVPSDRLFVTCRPCNHVWIAAYLPMQMDKMAAAHEGAALPEMCREEDLRRQQGRSALYICEGGAHG